MKKTNEKYIVSILSILIMVFSIHIGSTLLKKVQIDTTDESLYSLSEGSINILNKLNTSLKVKLYYSKTAANKGSDGIRQFNNYFQYVKDFLEQYVAKSNNNLSLEIIDPRPDTRDEEDAIAYGLKKFNLTETETYFFGLVVENATGAEKTIEFLNPNENHRLEYDITKLIYSATDPKKPRVGIVSSLEVIKEDISPYLAQLMRFQGKKVEESWQFVKALGEFYDVVDLKDKLEDVPAVDILIVFHPKNFDKQTLFQIDQFVVKGGKLMVLLDPMALADQSVDENGNPVMDLSSSLSILDKWGIHFDSKKLVGDKHLAGAARVAPNSPPVKTLPLIACNHRCFKESNDIISSTLNYSHFVFAGAVTSSKIENIEHSAFVSTTDKGNTFSANQRQLQNMQGLWRSFTEGEKKVHLAMKAMGKFKTNYPEGITVEQLVDEASDDEKKKDSKEKSKEKTVKLEAVLESKEPGAIIVFGDVDFISDSYAFKNTVTGKIPSNDSLTLVLNALESLTGSTDLLSVRSKNIIDRGFNVIRQIELDAEKKTADKVKVVNEQINKVRRELSALGRQANEENIAVIQNEGIKKRKELSRKIAILKRELRDIKREGREKVENLGSFLQTINTVLVPLIFLFIGFVINYKRRRTV